MLHQFRDAETPMMRLIWVDGRLAWPLVVAIVYVTCCVLGFDIAWRLLVLPFDRLVIYAAVLDLAVAALLISFWIAAGRKNRSRA
jgi:hypothetical protein